MTTIAWDGKTLAVDRMGVASDVPKVVTKLKVLESANGREVLAVTGCITGSLIMMDWYKNGADPEKWPKIQETDDWCRMVVATRDGVFEYERHPVKIALEERFYAWGGGREVALGALAMGATAEQAVLIASKFDTNTGYGVDVGSPA